MNIRELGILEKQTTLNIASSVSFTIQIQIVNNMITSSRVCMDVKLEKLAKHNEMNVIICLSI